MSQRAPAVRSQLFGDFSQTDLNKLQLQHGRAEAAKRAYTVKTQGLIYRDKQEIQRLQDEHEELLRNLKASQSPCSRWTDASVVQNLTALLTCEGKTDEELRAEKGKVASLKDQILKWERKLAGQKTGGGTTRHRWKSDNSNTCLLENKLHRGRKYFSELMTKNGQLREELKILQVERKHFLHVQSGLEKELHAIRKDICNLMTKCTEAFNASVKIQEKQRMLMDQNTKDISHYIKERSSLEQEISHYCNFGAFLDLKAIVHVTQDIDHKKVEKCKHLGSKEWALEDFEDCIKKIFRETAESNLDNLVRSFIQKEGQNYTLLNFVNYQHNEAETIRKQISQLCDEREIISAEEQQQQEQQQTLQMRLSIKQEATEQQLIVYEQRIQFMEKLLNQLKEGVNSLLQISYNSLVIVNQLGSSNGVQDDNVTEYLRMVEDKVNELLTLQSYLHFQKIQNQWDIDSLSAIAGQLLGVTQPPVNLTTSAARHSPDNNQDSLESVLLEAKEPVSREDLLTLVNKRIQRKKKTD
ncbi:outer dynein arm-docking complex subunit 1-like [Trachinotus anak]|uniref:outer dynein arm-docking complex subunit 1-like n=1 Tax=Trachinotus anak TaxID=443729 RepID=UPI0039F19999